MANRFAQLLTSYFSSESLSCHYFCCVVDEIFASDTPVIIVGSPWAKHVQNIARDKATTINTSTTGIHIKILAPKGLIRINQGNGNGIATGFTSHGESMAVKVVPISASE